MGYSNDLNVFARKHSKMITKPFQIYHGAVNAILYICMAIMGRGSLENRGFYGFGRAETATQSREQACEQLLQILKRVIENKESTVTYETWPAHCLSAFMICRPNIKDYKIEFYDSFIAS